MILVSFRARLSHHIPTYSYGTKINVFRAKCSGKKDMQISRDIIKRSFYYLPYIKYSNDQLFLGINSFTK